MHRILALATVVALLGIHHANAAADARCPVATCSCACEPCAGAAPARGGTGGNVGTPLPLGGTLWKVNSAGWTGWLDFLSDGRYLTHWGWGRWVQKGTTLHLTNDYDPYSFDLTVRGTELTGSRNDGSSFSGTFLARYAP